MQQKKYNEIRTTNNYFKIFSIQLSWNVVRCRYCDIKDWRLLQHNCRVLVIHLKVDRLEQYHTQCDGHTVQQSSVILDIWWGH